MKSFYYSQISKLNALIIFVIFGVATAILPVLAAPQEACVKTSTGDVVCGTPVSKPRANSKKPQSNVKEAQGIFYLFKGCNRSDSTVKCNFTLTSKRTTVFSMTAYSNQIIDNEGKSYVGSLADIASSRANRLAVTIEPGINYALVITFENVPEQVTTAPLFKLDNGIQYRNVSMSN
jgi:hypothetical protein